MGKRKSSRVNRRRRAEIGAERRLRTRDAILQATLELLGRPHGRATRIEDVCRRARVSRGTFYNYFTSIEDLLDSLSAALTREFDAAVHAAFDQLDGPAERTCAAIRYYLHGAIEDPRWGWAMVNSSVGATLFGPEISNHVEETIREGIDDGVFTPGSARAGRDILLGTGVAATISVLQPHAPSDYPETIAFHLLLSLGAAAELAATLTHRPVRDLPRIAPDSAYFRGVLGGAKSSAVAIEQVAARVTAARRKIPGQRRSRRAARQAAGRAGQVRN